MSMIGYLSLSVLAVGLTAPVSWGAYMTGFEDPPFKADQTPNNKDSWTGSLTASIPLVTSAQHAGSTGTQSVWIPKNTSASSGITRIFTTTESTAQDNGLTFDFMPATGSGAGDPVGWFYVFAADGSSDQGANGGYIQFYLVNAASAAGATPQFKYHPAGTSVWSYVSLPAGAWINGQWNAMQVTFDSAHQTMDFSINGTSIATDLGINTAATAATRFSRAWIFEADKNDLYIDNVSVVPVPEPASFAVLGLGGAVMLMRRRRA